MKEPKVDSERAKFDQMALRVLTEMRNAIGQPMVYGADWHVEYARRLRIAWEREAAARQEPVSEIDMHGMTLNQYADKLFERATQMVNSADGALAVQASLIIRWLATKLYAEPVPAGDAVSVRADVIGFLRGESPIDGHWYDESWPPLEGKFWWRKYLPEGK
jgi:hypothetical protein